MIPNFLLLCCTASSEITSADLTSPGGGTSGDGTSGDAIGGIMGGVVVAIVIIVVLVVLIVWMRRSQSNGQDKTDGNESIHGTCTNSMYCDGCIG